MQLGKQHSLKFVIRQRCGKRVARTANLRKSFGNAPFDKATSRLSPMPEPSGRKRFKVDSGELPFRRDTLIPDQDVKARRSGKRYLLRRYVAALGKLERSLVPSQRVREVAAVESPQSNQMCVHQIRVRPAIGSSHRANQASRIVTRPYTLEFQASNEVEEKDIASLGGLVPNHQKQPCIVAHRRRIPVWDQA